MAAPAASKAPVELYSHEIVTPLGAMIAVASDRGLALCEFVDRPMLPTQMHRIEALFGPVVVRDHEILRQTQRELDEYFSGARETFTLPLVLDASAFQMSVCRELRTIPYAV